MTTTIQKVPIANIIQETVVVQRIQAVVQRQVIIQETIDVQRTQVIVQETVDVQRTQVIVQRMPVVVQKRQVAVQRGPTTAQRRVSITGTRQKLIEESLINIITTNTANITNVIINTAILASWMTTKTRRNPRPNNALQQLEFLYAPRG
jgi:hypothetical protein